MKMGFEKMRFAKNYNNKRITDTIGGIEYHFRSQLEWKVAVVLHFLKGLGEIKNWAYEQTTFTFPDDKWLVDFDVINNDGTFYYLEAKGHFEARDRKKLQLLSKYRPEVDLRYVVRSPCDMRRMKTSTKYCTMIYQLTSKGLKTILERNSVTF